MLPRKNKRSQSELIEIGSAVVAIFETGKINRKELFKTSFFKGVVTGFGGVIGATVGVALFLWLISLFKNVWFLDSLVEKIVKAVNAAN